MFDDVRDLYSEAILAHGRAPSHAARPEGWNRSARGDNPMCGDRVTVFVRSTGPGMRAGVDAAGFEARGCELVKASADLMCDAVAGRAIDAVRDLASEVEAMARSGQIPDWTEAACPHCAALWPLSAVHEFPSRIRCVTLPWTALVAALDGTENGEAARD